MVKHQTPEQLQRQVWGIANICYTPENIDRANQYLVSRGLNPQHLAYPYAITGPMPDYTLAPYIHPQRVVNTLLIPIPSIRDPRLLAGFDCRYIGTDNARPRYSKIKGSPPEPLIYGIHRAMEQSSDKPIVLTEGAIDAETIYMYTGIPAVSYLTAMAAPSVVATLAALSQYVLLCLDNDQDGFDTANKMFNIAQRSSHTSSLFTSVNYRGKDPNDTLKSEQTLQSLYEGLKQAIGLAQQPRLMPSNPYASVSVTQTPAESYGQEAIINPFSR